MFCDRKTMKMLSHVYLIAALFIGGLTAAETGNITNLIEYFEIFQLTDTDDDGYIEYGEIRDRIIGADVNNDGVASFEEINALSKQHPITAKMFAEFDIDNDGTISKNDIELFFFNILAGAGNDLNLRDYIEFMVDYSDEVGTEITIKSFVKAVYNFRVMDINDDKEFSIIEFQREFRTADYNHNGALDKIELKGFRPNRNMAITCSDPNACTYEDLSAIYNFVDVDADNKIDLEVYIRATTIY